MNTKSEKTPKVVYIVTCYQSIVGVYASQDDASIAQRELILKNRPCDVLCRSVIESLKNS